MNIFRACVIAGSAAMITVNCALIVPNPPNWLILFFEIPTYIGWTYQSSAWIIANVVAFGFIMYFDDMILVSESEMKKFCFGTCLILSVISITLDYISPMSNTVMFFLFQSKPDVERYVFANYSNYTKYSCTLLLATIF